MYVDDGGHHLLAPSGTTSSFEFYSVVQSDTFILPCLPTHPDVNVTLWKGPERVHLDRYISFNPKVSHNILPYITKTRLTLRKIFPNEEFLSTQKMRLPQKRVHQDDSNDTPQPMWVEPCQNLYCGLRLAWIILIHSKGFGRAQPT